MVWWDQAKLFLKPKRPHFLNNLHCIKVHFVWDQIDHKTEKRDLVTVTQLLPIPEGTSGIQLTVLYLAEETICPPPTISIRILTAHPPDENERERQRMGL